MNKNNTNSYVTFWGTRGSISTPGSQTEKYGGNTPCVSIEHQNTTIIMDAGTGIRNLGLELLNASHGKNVEIDLHLLLSHTHWDHIQGLPFFTPAYMKGVKLTIYGSPKKERFLEAILQGQMDVNYFPVQMTALNSDLSIREFTSPSARIGECQISWQEQTCHPGGSVRYKIAVGRKRIVYATDVELDKIFAKGNRNKDLKALGEEYREFIHGADLLIADGQYTEEEYPSKIGWGHTSIPTLLDIAHQEKVKQLAVFHHDPQHSDAIIDTLWARYAPKYSRKAGSMNIFWAREGMTLPV